jgi:sodium-dependent dicarboxylate transporter 2/3/5
MLRAIASAMNDATDRAPSPLHPQLAAAEPAPPAQNKAFRAAVIVALIASVLAAWFGISDPMLGRATILAAVALILWLSELIPLYATTLVLLAGCALLLGPLDPKAFSLSRVLAWTASPVMALFFGGFALSAAGSKYGIDRYIAAWIIHLSGHRRAALLATVMAGTALLSMWMSNIAAAAMMLATLGPLIRAADAAPSFRRALLLGVAFAADFGGIATPLGTGPNLIAIGAIENRLQITFVQWMMFGVPLAGAMLALTYVLLVALHGVRGQFAPPSMSLPTLDRRGWSVVALFLIAVTAWLTEPLHGVPSATTALALAGALFASRLLDARDLAHMEWDTLMLIAGGLALGELFHASGLADEMAKLVNWSALPAFALVLVFVVACATLSAIASNTAAAAMLIQIGLGIVDDPAYAILIALGASMGVPLVISTPPNAMVYGKGGLRPRDLAIPGMILMLIGCVALTLIGPRMLQAILGAN